MANFNNQTNDGVNNSSFFEKARNFNISDTNFTNVHNVVHGDYHQHLHVPVPKTVWDQYDEVPRGRICFHEKLNELPVDRMIHFESSGEIPTRSERGPRTRRIVSLASVVATSSQPEERFLCVSYVGQGAREVAYSCRCA
ncbi:hypothetical protein V5O48_017206 [Marasmius crinis-equi]|uniref:Uncharacterized protein n=1 Tax=Marasmius crinis-equi TaxID=585013 RepID=A0ABR3EPU3_9AGAR